ANSYLANSVDDPDTDQDFAGTGDPSFLQVGNSSVVKPEKVTSFEVGYRGKLEESIVVDLSVYYNIYKDFISNETVVAPFYGQVDADDNGQVDMDPVAFSAIANGDFKAYQTYTNSPADVSSYGAAIGVSAKVFGNYDFDVNY